MLRAPFALKLLLLSWLLLSGAWVRQAAADALPDAAGRQAIQAVIGRQIEAFRHDNAEGAFSYASPNIQQMFGSADNFMRMVRQGYQPVYRPGQVHFGVLDLEEGRLTQRVILQGPDGLPVTALYFMQQMPDGSWRIDGCILLPVEDRST